MDTVQMYPCPKCGVKRSKSGLKCVECVEKEIATKDFFDEIGGN